MNKIEEAVPVRFQVLGRAPSDENLLRALVHGLPNVVERNLDAPAYASIVEQVADRLFGKEAETEKQITLASGSVFTVDVADRFARMIYLGYLQEAGDFNIFRQLVEPGACIIDVGANFGLYTVEAARMAGESGRVYSFEPGPEAASLLQRNIALNGLQDRVKLHREAVSHETGNRTFYVANSSSLSGFTDTGRSELTRTMSVPCVSLDSIDALKERAVDLIKVDVEGSELDVFAGAEALIERSPNLVILFEATTKNLSTEAQQGLLDWLKRQLENGFNLFRGAREEPAGLPLRSTADILANLNGNFFLARKNSSAERRLLAAFESEATEHHKSQTGLQIPEESLSALVSLYRMEIALTRKRNEQLTEAQKVLETERQQRDQIERLAESDKQQLADYQQRTAAYEQQLNDARRELAGLRGSVWWRLGVRYIFPIFNLGEKTDAARKNGTNE